MFPPFNRLVFSKFDENSRLLAQSGVSHPERTLEILMEIRQWSESFEGGRPEPVSTPPWFRSLRRILKEAPSSELVLDVVYHFIQRQQHPSHAFTLFEQNPRSLEILARVACGSPFLTRCILSLPDALGDLTGDRGLAEVKSRDLFRGEVLKQTQTVEQFDQKLIEVRHYQRREILRIGMCDAFGLLDLKFVTLQISLLADAMVQACLALVCGDAEIPEESICVLALGKHGGEELNYSSDIDLVVLAENPDSTLQRLARRLIDALSQNMTGGFLYRVDMRLRPWGDAGPLVISPRAWEAYLQQDAALWERQALLKARVIAGDQRLGAEFLRQLPQFLFADDERAILPAIARMKSGIEQRLGSSRRMEVKLGAGTIRDIEFLTQALQLIHGRREKWLLNPNTLESLIRLTEFNILTGADYRTLREGYIFFRTVEHALQLLHNQQTHEIPQDPEQQEWLSRRLDFQSASQLLERFHEHRRAVRRIFDGLFSGAGRKEASSASGDTVSTSNAAKLTDVIEISEAMISGYGPVMDSSTGCRLHITRDGNNVRITLVCADTPGVLSVICGVFFLCRVSIQTGETVVGPHQIAELEIPQGMVVATFSGTARTDFVSAAELEDQISRFLRLHRSAEDLATPELLEAFCDRLQEDKAEGASASTAEESLETAIQVINEDPAEGTRLELTCADSIGLFFEVANALSICGYRIRSAVLNTEDNRVHDVICVSEDDGSPVTDPDRLEELQTAIILIREFTSWLPQNSDPRTALLRFRDLLQQLLRGAEWSQNAQSLQSPDVLQTIGKVLGMSRYLWEDFLRVNPTRLLPLLTDPRHLQYRVSVEELQIEWEAKVSQCSAPKAIPRILNTWKDDHLFRIDLRHVLGRCGPFGLFSQEITELAEVVVSAALEHVCAELSTDHGVPVLESGRQCGFVVAGLGKFGGVEMGFGSDIELFLIYDQDCRTNGRKSLSAGSYFERVIHRLQTTIESRRKGIFEIDLRMRPYGQAGPAAVTLAAFMNYFAPQGDAWPYERQALTRLRCVAGDGALIEQIRDARRKIVFGEALFDFSAMKAIREKQINQLVRGGTLNAKLSDGGLVDCEYAVQALQMTFGHHFPNLQTTNTILALEAAAEADLLTQDEVDGICSAYRLLRELIDCLRMVRGNAEDLTIPDPDSADFRQLGRRMRAVHAAPEALTELEPAMQTVRQFSARVEQICQN